MAEGRRTGPAETCGGTAVEARGVDGTIGDPDMDLEEREESVFVERCLKRDGNEPGPERVLSLALCCLREDERETSQS